MLFICTHNSARSQMAEGLLRHYYPDQYEVHSAGTAPDAVSPYAVEVMREVGIDIGGHAATSLDAYSDQALDWVVTVCDSAREHCPYLPARHNLHMRFTDPRATRGTETTILDSFRQVRDEIGSWIQLTFGPGPLHKSVIGS